jgi:hypothetical protein
VSQFFSPLTGPLNITSTAARMRSLDAAAPGCAICGGIPIELGEYNAGPVPDHSPFAMEYPGATFLAASIIQALEANVSTFTLFELSWLYNSTSGAVQPEGLLYQKILDNMLLGTAHSVVVHSGGLGDVEALEITDGSERSLLVVTANTTHALGLTIPSSILPLGAIGADFYWGPSYSTPIMNWGIGLPLTYDVGAEGILLMTSN